MAQAQIGTRQNGTLGYIDFPRDVTAQTRENAYAAYNHLAVQRVQAIGFNFSATDYMNSAGIGLIISLVEDAAAAGRKVFAYGLNSHNRKLFRMVGLTERLTLVADEAEMQAKVAPPQPAKPPSPQPTSAAEQSAAPATLPAPETQSEAQAAPQVEQPTAQAVPPAADQSSPQAEA
ncbi:MAG: STAS domain-containing protein [Aggregatilineales bacterium]